MNKLKLSQKSWARILAFILFILAVPAAMLGAANILIADSEDWYRSQQPLSFYESSFCINQAQSRVWDAASYEYYTHLPENAYYRRRTIDPQYSNFLYVVKTSDGKVLGQNCDGESAVMVLDTHPVSIYNNDQTINLYVTAYVRDPLEAHDEFYWNAMAFNFLYRMRYNAYYIGGISLVLSAALFVFLLRCAGRRTGHEGFVLAGADKIPLDIYAAFTLTAGFFSIIVAMSASSAPWPLILPGVGITLATAFFAAFSMTLAARIKTRTLFKNILMVRIFTAIWRKTKRAVQKTIGVLPLLWKLIVGYILYLIINALGAAALFAGGEFMAFIFLLLFNGALLYGLIHLIMQMLSLKRGGAALAGGDLSHKTDTEKMLWDFKEHGMNLNSISDGMAKAVDERMKSERFKTELITNVSHDIKTPLTAIVSYVDLLKREHIQSEKAAEYIEVLDRQSARLKKLTEDLVEASKVSAGTVNLSPERVDVNELLRQASGEYDKKLEQAGITPVLSVPEAPLFILADGRHLWRVFDNLISNICKYALSGTRAYFSAGTENGQVLVVFRNISASQMNITPDELLERFVRGDSSRSTEGSGLGLSIAKSLTELMGGRFEIRLDGDLFKIVLSFKQVV